MQAVWALLDGFRRDDWIALTIEPSENERVDLKWQLTHAQRHDQVKSTGRTFTKRAVESWAEELAGASAAEELRLVLFGNLGRGVTNGLTFGRVRIEMHTRDDDLLLPAIGYLSGVICSGMGLVVPYASCVQLGERVAARLLAESRNGRTWAREELLEEVMGLARAHVLPVEVPSLLERAQMVQNAMARHGMARQYEALDRGPETRVFRRCEWPPPPYADDDGYSEVVVRTLAGPGDHTATGATRADYTRFNGSRVALYYTFGAQGGWEHRPPIVVAPGDVIMVDGSSYGNQYGLIPEYPERNEVVVLRSSRYYLDDVRPLP